MRSPSSRRTLNVLLAALLVPIVLAGAGGQKAVASQLDVTTAADSGPGSLRQALLDAAALAGSDDVVVQAGLGTITLSSEIEWTGVLGTNDVTIAGNGVRVDFNGSSRGFVDSDGHGLRIGDMTITGVGGSAASDAAPVLSEGGEVVLGGCTIVGNTVTTTAGDAAGAVLSEGGSVTIQDCTISRNVANSAGDGAGGVLAEGGALDVSNSVIESNTVTAGGNAGGGLSSEGGNVSVTGTTVNCNNATTDPGADAGGGLLSEGGSVTVDSSTFAGNSATTSGGGASENGILSQGPVPVLTNTTVTDDQSACTPGGALTSDQQKCVNNANKGAARVVKAQNSTNKKCLSDAAKGKLTGTFNACLPAGTADPSSSVGKAKTKSNNLRAKGCTAVVPAPPFAYVADPVMVNEAMEAASIALTTDAFGDPASISTKDDKAGSSCQAAFQTNIGKSFDKLWSELLKAKKTSLKGTKNSPGATNNDELVDDLAGALQGNPSIQKAIAKITTDAGKKCPQADVAALFPGGCTSAQVATVAACAQRQVVCRACESLNAADDTGIDCDALVKEVLGDPAATCLADL